MAGAGAKKFPANSKLTSDDVNNYLADQVIMRFATTTARDAAFGGVGEPTLAEGMTCYIDNLNVLQTYDGSNWVTTTALQTTADVSSGLVWLNTTSFSAQTQIDFINVFSSTYTNYRIVFDFMTATVGENHFFRLRDSGGVIQTVNYLTQRLESATTSVNGLQVGGGFSTTWFPTYINTGTGAQISGTMDIFRPNEVANTTAIGQFIRNDPSFMYSVQSAHYFSLTTQMTGFSLIRNSTATLSGKVSVYGYRNT